MSSQQNIRRSTSALLYDENEKTKDTIFEQEPLLGYTDLEESGKSQPSHGRLYARYGLFKFIY
jgi:hypothetical protein